MAVVRRGPQHPAQRRRRQGRTARPTPRPRRCATRSTTSTTSTSPRSPRCGGAGASSPAGCSTSPPTRCRRTTTSPTSRGGCPTAAKVAGPSTPRSTKASPPTSSSAALFARFTSRDGADFADRLLSAMRKEFGGHDEKLDQTIGETEVMAVDRPVRRARVLRDVGRPRPQEDLPRALRDGEEGRARRPGHRRRVVEVDGRRPAPACPRQHHRVRRRRRRRGRVREAHRRCCATSTATTTTTSTFTELKKALGELQAPGALPRDPAEHVRDGRRGARVVGLRRERARDRREAVRARPRSRPRSSTRCSTRCSPRRTSSGSTTTWARRRSRTSSTSGSPTRSSSRSGTATTSARCRSRWRRTSACRAGASSTRRSARCATSSRTTCSRPSALLAMEPPVGPGVEELRDGKERVFAAMETLKPDDLVRGQFEGYRDEDGVAPDSDVETFAAVRLHIDSWRWAGVPFYVRAGKNLPVHVHRGAGRAAPAPDARVRRVRADCPTTPTTSASSSTPRISIAAGVRVKAAGDGFMGDNVELYLCNDHPGRGVGVRAAARRRAATARRCCSPAKTASRRRGGWSTTCSPTTAPRSRTRSTRGVPTEQDRLHRGPRPLARPDVVDRPTRDASSPCPRRARRRSRARTRPRCGPATSWCSPGQVGIGGRREARRRRDRGRDRARCWPTSRAVFDDCGAAWADVARATIFLTDLGNFATVNALYEGAIGAHRPGAHHHRRRGAARRRRGGDRVLGVPPGGVRQ